MTQVAGTTPNTRPTPKKTDAEIAEAKRLDKMQTVCSSHRTSGTAQRPTVDGAAKP